MVRSGAPPARTVVQASSRADDSAPFEMSVENALKLLGVSEGASFEDILRAKNSIIASCKDDHEAVKQETEIESTQMVATRISHINGAGTVPGKASVISPRKARAGRRKPLGDLTNAGKPGNRADGKKALDGSLNSSKPSVGQPSKQLKPKNLTVVMNDEAVPAIAKKLESNITHAIKTSGKSQTSNRKALSDISNSGNLHVPEAKNKNSLKPSHVRDLDLDEIAEEMVGLHNHQKCIKSQSEFGAVNVHQFYKALVNDLNDGFTIYSPPKKIKSEFDIEHWELEELPEEFPAIRSPVRPSTPESSSSSARDLDWDVDFKLMDSP